MDATDKKQGNEQDYDMNEVFDEVLEDDSWEPDRDKRLAAITALRASISR